MVSVMIKRLIILLLAAAFLTIPCAAAEAEPEKVLDEAEVQELMAPFIEKYGLDDTNFGLAFLYTGTNESYLINGDVEMYSASMYKVPLCMIIAEKVSLGELEQDGYFGRIQVPVIEESCLISSNNDVAGAVYARLRPNVAELLTQYSGLDADELPHRYQDLFYTPRFMLNTLQTLYENPERFPNIMDCMLQAQPKNYFHRLLGDRYEIAQKYGQLNAVLHNAGIIYTPTPIILVVMTEHIDNNHDLIGELAVAFADYALTLDERVSEMEEKRLAEEAAAAEQEEQEQQPQEQPKEEVPQEQVQVDDRAQAEQVRLAQEAADEQFVSALKGLGIATVSFAALYLAFILFRRFLF